MFNPFSHEDHDLDEAITSAFANLRNHDADSKEYQQIVNQLTELYSLKNKTATLNLEAQTTYASHRIAAEQSAWEAEQAARPFYQRVDPNVVLTVAGNVLVGIIVVKYEQTGVISSKVMSFMKKI